MIDKEKLLRFIKKEKTETYIISVNIQSMKELLLSHAYSHIYDQINSGRFDIPESKDTCKWDREKNKDCGYWNPTGCGEMYAEEYGGETDDYIYCPYCGKPIEEVKDDRV